MVPDDDARDEAYRRPLNVLVEELVTLPDEWEKLNNLERNGMLHGVQVVVDTAMRLAAMTVKDLGLEVKDDYHNLELLLQAGILDEGLAGKVKDLNGLRNAIVHK